MKKGAKNNPMSVSERARRILQRQPMYMPDEPDWSGDPDALRNDHGLDDKESAADHGEGHEEQGK